jgi:gas vesicle protein
MSAKRNLLIGVGVGAVLGILFAPHKGSKTRKKIAQRGRELKGGWNNLKDSVNNTFAKTSDTVDDFLDESTQTVSYISSTVMEDGRTT